MTWTSLTFDHICIEDGPVLQFSGVEARHRVTLLREVTLVTLLQHALAILRHLLLSKRKNNFLIKLSQAQITPACLFRKCLFLCLYKALYPVLEDWVSQNWVFLQGGGIQIILAFFVFASLFGFWGGGGGSQNFLTLCLALYTVLTY